jgi:hypothetical protein
MEVAIRHAIPRSALWVVPNGGHGPVFLDVAAVRSNDAGVLARRRESAGLTPVKRGDWRALKEVVRLVGVEPTTGKSPADFKPAAYANFATAAPAAYAAKSE